MNKITSPIKRLAVYAIVGLLVVEPAFAAVTDISNVPLSSGTTSVTPNVMFILDDSGSMERDFLPDYVHSDGNTTTAKGSLRRSDGSQVCEKGDPCYYAGGGNGFNGVWYDPNVNYKPGLQYNAATVQPATLSTTSLPPDAYLGGTNVNLTNGTVNRDRVFCNSNDICKRNGADNSGNILASGGIDADTQLTGTFTMAAGQFPYRSHKSNSSTERFGLPETMTAVANWTRSSTTVTFTTVAAHGFVAGDRIFVSNTGNSNIDGTSRTVSATALTATQFQFAITTSGGGTSGTAGFYRKHSTGTASRASSTVTVVSTAHGLQTGDVISTANHGTAALNVTNVVITKIDDDSFRFTTGTSSNVASGAMTWARTGLYNILDSNPTANPIVYRITPVEYCSDANLTLCTLATTPGTAPAGFPFPAYVRFCKTLADSIAPGAVTGNSGTTPRCLSKYIEDGTTYTFARYGLFTRDNIVSGTASYSGRPGRNDCASPPNCTYAEEIQNYARWYTYFRTRLNTMKTAGGRAFQSFIHNPAASPTQPAKLRVGFITINPRFNGSASSTTNVQGIRYLRVQDFAGGVAGSHAANWYSKFYAIGGSTANLVGQTPLRDALSTVGWIFSGKLGSDLTAGLNTTNDDPVQVSCQRNFAILTTDGYWNGGGGRMLNNSAMTNQDNVDGGGNLPGYSQPASSRPQGTYDGNLLSTTDAGTSAGGRNTLADVALYYYKNDLRGGTTPHTGPALNSAGVDVSNNNVPTKPGNKNFVTHQHMVTFSIGMVDGLMRFQPDYETSGTGDFASIKDGTSGACLWTGGQCNWPSPQANSASALDDLWHAAVNGRGQYYSARDAASLVTGLESALNALNIQVAAAAASSTSSPNITQTDRLIFSTTYETDTWSGRIVAQNINITTGEVEPTILWQADTQLLTKVTAASDTRVIKTFCFNTPTVGSCGSSLKNFTWDQLHATERAYFTNKCSSLPTNMSQCNLITGGATQADVNDGAKMVGYLRGWTGLELNADLSVGSFRDRKFVEPGSGTVSQTILGDTINAKPAFVRNPLFSYGDAVTPTYTTFKTANALRSPRLYVGANDGYLHAFHGDTGEEMFAYLPRFLMSGLWVLADSGYKNRHTYFADGSPETADVYDSVSSSWRTILVAGVNSGGRGYYALDVTDPDAPKGLWEFCADSTVCTRSHANLGLTYGNPVIGKRASDGRWVVVLTSGLNNVGTGDGGGYFYVLDALDGTILDTIPTAIAGVNVGTVTTPSGLAKIAGFFDNAATDATFRYVYGGDQLGNIWRLDVRTTPPTLLHMGTLKDSAGKVQPITTKPLLTKISGQRILYYGTGRYLGAKDLSDPATHVPPDLTTAWQQSLYALKDKDIDYGANVRTGATLVTQSLSNVTAQDRTTTENPVDWNTKDGWVMDFNPGNSSPGERVNIDPELILGTLLVTTNVPIQSTGGASCSIGGDSWQYQLDFRSGSFLSTSTNQVAGRQTGSVVTVGVAVVQLPGGAIKSIVTGADTGKTTLEVNLGAGAGIVRRFSYRER
jgi:type IV pilus assembly protein PilY1